MKAMAKHRSHSIEFKRQVAQEFIAGETLHALSKRHDISRQLMRIFADAVEKLFRHRARATLIQRKSRARKIDSRSSLCGFNSCSNAVLKGVFPQHPPRSDSSCRLVRDVGFSAAQRACGFWPD
jgi:transposase